MNKQTLGFAVLGCIATACAATGGAGSGAQTAPSSESKHQIVIARPFAVGQRVRVEVNASEDADAVATKNRTEELEIDGLTNDRKVTLRGIFDVQAVDEAGRVLRVAFHVEHFFDELAKRAILPQGTLLMASRESGNLVALVNGQPPAADVADWLQLTFPVGRPGGALVSDALGTSSPKAVGESWEISKEKAASDLVDDGYQSTETSVAGKVTLVGVASCGSGECLELAGELQVEQAKVSDSWGVAGIELGKVAGKARMLLPVDTNRPVFLEDSQSTGTFVVDLRANQSGNSAQAEVSVKRRRVATYALIQ